MTTYKEQQENKMSYVLLKDCEVLGTFGNLRKVCDFMEGKDFPSYWTLVRKKENPLVIEDYKIHKVKHY
ncbi:hypothetical protein [Winogradskyella luteola]|uniref:Uncharacterized protein n=1 Tax=Winogradskyella luteola TaxID=2828330 RepID=A0A9X1F7L1_9FLAO|nr:hypothetical protein [Winogradskyella luteola]MBV7268694.1 hypothetical protein [Winogradskyella luteola]